MATDSSFFGKSNIPDSSRSSDSTHDPVSMVFTATTTHTDSNPRPPDAPHTQSTDGELATNTLPFVDRSSSYTWPINILESIQKITSLPPLQVKSSNFLFQCSEEAAKHNWDFITQFGNLGIALAVDAESHTKYGSEFRPCSILRHIFRHHPLWPKLSNILQHGISFPLEDLDDTTKLLDIENALTLGNHKGVQKHPHFFQQLSFDDITNGYAIPIPKSEITKLRGAAICPMNIIEQYTISKSGEIVDKQRACHDLSFLMSPSNTSVNSRVLEDKLAPCMFGHCLTRIIHYIVALRLKFPSTPILMQKTDFKSAYRRAHMHWKTSIQCCSVFKQLVLIPLRAVFGGSPCPSEWSIISESTCDLANMLLSHSTWDPNTLHSPIQLQIPPPVIMSDDVPFHPGRPLMVQIPINQLGKADVFIDDIVTVALGTEAYIQNADSAVPLAIHILGRPVAPNEPIPRQDLICLKKLEAEGRLEEKKTVLGWNINTRLLTINLPHYKYKVWKASIVEILQNRFVRFKELETLLGRLTHLCVIMPHILHFLGNLRRLCMSAEKRRKVKIHNSHSLDLDLMLLFLAKAHQGIDMNTITFRRPTHIYYSDASPFGLGGYNHWGKAWRFSIPNEMRFKATINMLEHISSTIGPWIDIIDNDLPPSSCILSMTDSTTSAGWLRKSNFANTNETKLHHQAKMEVSRMHATRMMKHNIREYSQWFPGTKNIVADSLSRDFHLDDETLTTLFHSHFDPQIPPQFKIAPLPHEINCWICAWLRGMPDSRQRLEAPHRSNIEHGFDGSDFSPTLIFPGTYTFNQWTPNTESPSLLHSPRHSEELITLAPQFLSWLETRSEIPSTMWLRPSATTNTQTHDWTEMEELRRFYSTNIKHTRAKTHHLNNKKPSQGASCHNYINSKPPKDSER